METKVQRFEQHKVQVQALAEAQALLDSLRTLIYDIAENEIANEKLHL